MTAITTTARILGHAALVLYVAVALRMEWMDLETALRVARRS